MSFGDRLKDARKHAGITQEELANRCGLATGTVQRYELNTRNPKRETVAKLANALNLGYFFTRTGEAVFYDFVDTVESKTSKNNVFNDGQLSNISNAERLIKSFDALNDEGQEKAIERVEELTEIPKYQRKEPDEPEDG